MLLTDTHCHLDFDTYDLDRQTVISRARDAGVVRFLIPGLNHASCRKAIKIAEAEEGFYTAVGFHPTELKNIKTLNLSIFQDFARHPKVIAIGEIGLDYYWVREEEKRLFQRQILIQQLDIAAQVQKPVIIHMREEGDKWYGNASDDLLRILSKWRKDLSNQAHPLKDRPGVLHSFNGTMETGQKAMELGFYIGVTGPITYKNADEKRRIIKQFPLDRLLIETDSPFLTPVPHRGKRNEPAFVYEIADKIAEIKSINLEEVAKITTQNASLLFLW